MKNTCFRFAVVSILLLWSAATAVAQTFAVRGEVYDTESRTALPLFPVQLLAADSSSMPLALPTRWGASAWLSIRPVPTSCG